MNQSAVTVILKRFDAPDETRTLVKGKFELVRFGGHDDRSRDVRTRLEVERTRWSVRGRFALLRRTRRPGVGGFRDRSLR